MGDALYLGTRKGLFQLQRQGDDWSVVETDFLGAQVPIVKPVNEKQVYAALNHGHFGAKLQRSADAGRSWEEITTPAYPPKPDDVPDVMDPTRNKPVPWSLELIWSLAHGSDDKLWCGTLPGGLFTSGDRGLTWELNEALWHAPERANWFGGGYDWPGIHSICIDPRDPQRVTLGISCGGVWYSADGGATWECRGEGMRAAYMPPERQFDPTIQDPHLLVQCPAAPDHFWTQHHNGIFRSTDYCQNWSELPAWKPSSFGFAVVVHPTDPNTAWFAPAISDETRYPADARFVITRTSDGGETHDVLTSGLPQEHAYHLVFRHALAIDSDGETLAVGSTTGGLWISHNRGDDWTTITQDLPPIFCVQFA